MFVSCGCTVIVGVIFATLTLAVPVARAYVASPLYCAVIVSLPAVRPYAGMVNVTSPPESGPVTSPLAPLSATLPVGVPLDPLTVTVTFTLWLAGKLLVAGVTVTVALAVPIVDLHALTTFAIFNEPSPVAASKPVVAPQPDRIPILSPAWVVVQLGEFSVQGIAMVPVSMSLNAHPSFVLPFSALQLP